MRAQAFADAVVDEPWQLPVEHFSASSLNMLQRCPEQYRQRYILGKKERPGASLVLGTANHEALEFNLVQKIESGEDRPVEEVVEYYNDEAWPAAIEKNGGVDEVEWDDKPETLRGTGARMVEAYQRTTAPRIQPAKIEERYEARVNGLPVPLIGYIDCVQIEQRPTIDWKTSARKRSKLKPDWRLQGRIYQLFEPRPVDWQVITKAKTPEVITGLEEPGLMQPYSEFTALATIKHVRQLGWLANHFHVTYGPDRAWPATGIQHDWACDWCAYRRDCAIWKES